MAHKALGKHYQEGLSLIDISSMFPANQTGGKLSAGDGRQAVEI